MARELRTNERIRSREVRLIGGTGENYGVITFADAMNRAREAGLDLVEVDGNSNPPVCRILDYGKWKYEQAKKEREGRKHQKGTMIHEVRLRPRTGKHDIDLKVRIVERLLAEGDKVKLSVMFRGRELSHPEVGREVLDKALSSLKEAAIVEKQPGMEGRFLSVILIPTIKKPTPKVAEGKAEAKPAEANGAGAAAEAAPTPAAAAAPTPAPAAATPAPNVTEGKAEAKPAEANGAGAAAE
ncbi:MAG: translation initiation factor IF-3, partial [Chloroflexota bacterium]